MKHDDRLWLLARAAVLDYLGELHADNDEVDIHEIWDSVAERIEAVLKVDPIVHEGQLTIDVPR